MITMTMTPPYKCAVCAINASQLCGGCKSVAYCSKEHQKEHWKSGHKQQCKCYEVSQSAVLGRHLRATRDIKAGEIIHREMPLVYGPKVASAPICLGCHRNLPTPQPPASNYYKCSKCTWPLCGSACETASTHVEECALMAASKFQTKINYSAENERNGKKESAYCVILLMRCMLLRTKQPEAFQRIFDLEDHLQERIDTPLYQVLRANLITFIKTILGMHEWTELEILRIAAVLDTNTFEVRQAAVGRKVRALYPAAAMLSHDCTPNARHTFDEQMQIIFLAKQKIAKGEIIAISYTQPLSSTLMRRSHLLQAKCFNCSCARCCDPTELGTYAGALLCGKCKVGKFISTNPLENNAKWKCELCSQQKSAKDIIANDAAIQKEIEALDKSSPVPLENFLHANRDVLHSHNTHMLQVKYALTQLYGNCAGYSLAELTDAALKRKIELCEELLQLAEILDGGWSIFRGNLLIDMQEALVTQAQRLKDQSAATEKLESSANMLQEISNIMKFEPDMRELLNERTQTLAAELERAKAYSTT